MDVERRARLRFGWLPRADSYATEKVEVAPLENFEAEVERVRSGGRLAGKWHEPPLEQAAGGPLVYMSAYLLPSTHSISVEGVDDAEGFADLAIAMVGLVQGVRLVRDGWIHFYRAPVVPRAFGDLLAHRPDVEKLLPYLAAWWEGHSVEARGSLFAAAHWYVFGHCYRHQFEQFNAQYIALDALFGVHRATAGPMGKVPHYKRPALLASFYGLAMPGWAVVQEDARTCELSALRNELVHEARYAGKPIGFAHPKRNLSIAMELAHFNCRLILAMLGVPAAYVRSRVDQLMPHGLHIDQAAQVVS